MPNTNQKITETSDAFDLCVSELSQDAQAYFAYAVTELVKQLAKGGGEKSAKELLFSIAMLDKPINNQGE